MFLVSATQVNENEDFHMPSAHFSSNILKILMLHIALIVLLYSNNYSVTLKYPFPYSMDARTKSRMNVPV